MSQRSRARRWGFLAAAGLALLVAGLPEASAGNSGRPPAANPSCESGLVYAGQEVEFPYRFSFNLDVDDQSGFLVDSLHQASAFLEYQRTVYRGGHGSHGQGGQPQPWYVYEVYGTLGEYCP